MVGPRGYYTVAHGGTRWTSPRTLQIPGYNPPLMRTTCALVALALGVAAAADAQSRPDLAGLWIGPTADISVVLLPGEEVSLTPYGAERYRKVDQANSPAYKCLPYGPTRGLQSTNPFQIIQTPDLIAIITEHIDYRLIYMDGRRHPADILDYPEWMGHSIGRRDGDTLDVDTICMLEETWLVTAALFRQPKIRHDGSRRADCSRCTH